MTDRSPTTPFNRIRRIVLPIAFPVVLVWGAWSTIPSHNPAKLPFVLSVTLASVAMVTLSMWTILKQKVPPANLSFLRSLILILGCGFIFFGVQWLTAEVLVHLHDGHAGAAR